MLSNCINQTYIIRIIFTYQKSLLPFEKFGLISCILTGIFLYQKLQLTRIRGKFTSADIPNLQCLCYWNFRDFKYNKIEKRFNLKPREKGSCFINLKVIAAWSKEPKMSQKVSIINLIENLIFEKDFLDLGHCGKLDYA